jgi:hypothetical protein
MEDPSYSINIVKLSYENIIQSAEVLKVRNQRRYKWNIYHYMINTNKLFTNFNSLEFKELENKLINSFAKIIGNKKSKHL